MNLPTLRQFLKERPSPHLLLFAGRHFFRSNSGVSEKRGIQYGPLERQKLDIYKPIDIDRDTETIVFFYGGGWETGNKDIHKFIGRSWARQNYVVILPNYRLAPESTYPAQLEDISKSLTWLRSDCEDFTSPFYLAGHSAGAHLASLVGFSGQWRERAELTNDEIAGFILLSGIYQFGLFEEADRRIRDFIGEKRYWEEAQSFNHIDDSLPPVFLTHGREDTEVLPMQSVQMKEKLDELNVENELLLEDDIGHIGLLLETTKRDAVFWRMIDDFFAEDLS